MKLQIVIPALFLQSWALAQELQAFTFLDNTLTIESPDSGAVQVKLKENPGSLFDGTCETALNVDDTVAVQSNNFEICFKKDAFVSSDSQEKFKVIGVNGAGEEVGDALDVTLNVRNPVNPPPVNRLVAIEDTSTNFSAGRLFVAQEGLGLGENGVQLIVQSVIDASVGTLRAGDSDVAADTVIASNATIAFIPADDFFNALGDLNENQDGDEIFANGCPDIQLVDGECAALMTYTIRTTIDDVSNAEADIPTQLIVNAVDDKQPTLRNSPETIPVLVSGEAEASEVAARSNEFEIVSDKNQNVFKVGVRMDFKEVENFFSHAALNSAEDPEVEGFAATDDQTAVNCSEENVKCKRIEIKGTTNRVNNFMKKINFNVPNEVGAIAEVDVFLADSGFDFPEEAADTVEVVVINNDDDENNNAAVIAVVSIIGGLLVVAALVGFYVNSKGEQDKDKK